MAGKREGMSGVVRGVVDGFRMRETDAEDQKQTEQGAGYRYHALPGGG